MNGSNDAVPREEDDAIRKLGKMLNSDEPAELEQRMGETLREFREDLREHPYIIRQRRRSRVTAWGRRPTWRRFLLALAAGTGTVCVAVAVVLTLWSHTPTWAQVVEQFQSAPFCSAVVYVKEDTLAEPEQHELWLGSGGRVRIRVGTQVVFARDGEVPRAFDITTRGEVEPDYRAIELLEMLGGTKSFSLETVIAAVSGGEAIDVTPALNYQADISEDLVVFEVSSEVTAEWIRIWALRKSKLPVHVRVWDARDGESVDAVFTYSKEQPPEFFDPRSFASELSSGAAGSTNLAYALLKDPGGRPTTPQDLFKERAGYHVPVVRDVGITEDGAIWVVAARSSNSGPNGQWLFGFQRVEDDLGQEYYGVYSSSLEGSDGSIQVFVPLDYPFDERVPTELRLICENQYVPPGDTGALIGTVEVTEWKQGEKWPSSMLEEDFDAYGVLAAHLLQNKDWERLERYLDSTPGEPEKNERAFRRERLRLAMLVERGQFDEAVALGEKLLPLLEEEYLRWRGNLASPYMFNDYLIALAAKGRIGDARDLFRRIGEIERPLPGHLNKRAQEHIRKSMQVGFDSNLKHLAIDLSHQTELSAEQISEIVGVDVKTDERFKGYSGFFGD